MEITKETVDEFAHGHRSVGTTRVQVAEFNLPSVIYKGVLLKAGEDNEGVIWVGGSAVTADSDVGTGGLPLKAGESLTLPLSQMSKVYLIADEADQDLAWMTV